MIYLAIWLWVIGVITMNALSHQASTSQRTWKTRFSIIFWPITSTIGLVVDLYDLCCGGDPVDWMKP